MVTFYEGNYLYKLGYPFVVITSQRVKGGDYGAEVFIFIQQVPLHTYTLESHRFSGVTFSDKPENPEAVLAEEALHWTRLHLEGKQQAALDHAGISAMPREFVLRAKDWRQELLRMRLRGLSDEMIGDITEKTASDELAIRLKEVLRDRPIVVKEVKI